MSIDKIILKTINDQASLEELEVLESWKNESDQNIEFLKTMSNNYKDIDYKQFDKESAWQNINNRLDSPKSYTKYIIAVLLIFLVASAAYYFINNSEDKLPTSFASTDQIQNIKLIDQSQIWLNKNSSLDMTSDFSAERKVDLNGEAFFEVKADQNNPFIININETEFIKVVGTSFNVLNQNENFDLTVYSGHVEFHALNRVIHLNKNDRIVKVNGAYTKILNRDQNILSWKNKELIFDNINLKSALNSIEKHYNVEFNYDKNLDFNKCNLRTKFSFETITEVLEELQKLYTIDYTIDNQSIQISSLNCK